MRVSWLRRQSRRNQLSFSSAASSYWPSRLKVMVMSSSVWMWCIVMVRVSPSATAFCNARAPPTIKSAARPHE